MAAPSLSGNVVNFIMGESDSEIDEITQRLVSKSCTILELVEALGEYLASQDVHIRRKGTELLSRILASVASTINSTEGDVLCTFYTQRLQDHHSILSPALSGLCTLVSLPCVPRQTVSRVARTLFQEVQTQALPVTDRHAVLKILHLMLTTHQTCVKDMDGDFVFGFIQAVDGEKDPRVLLLAFACSQIIATNFQLGVFGEELFEVVSCYFPVDFTPSSNDSYTITREQLADALRDTLICSPQFAEYAMPLFLEKLNSAIPSAKIEALLCMQKATKSFSREVFIQHQNAIWANVKAEFQGFPSAELCEACEKMLTALSTVLSQAVTSSAENSAIKDFCSYICDDCDRHLRDPSSRLQLAHAQLLVAVARGGVTARDHLLAHVITLSLQLFKAHSSDSERVSIMKMVLLFMKLCTKEVAVESSMRPRMEELLALFLSECSHGNPQRVCLGLSGLVSVLRCHQEPHVSGSLLAAALASSLQLALSSADVPVRREASRALVFFSIEFVSLMKENVITPLCQNLAGGDSARALPLLVDVSTSADVIRETLPALLDHTVSLMCSGQTDAAVSALGQLRALTLARAADPPCRCLLAEHTLTRYSDMLRDVLSAGGDSPVKSLGPLETNLCRNLRATVQGLNPSESSYSQHCVQLVRSSLLVLRCEGRLTGEGLHAALCLSAVCCAVDMQIEPELWPAVALGVLDVLHSSCPDVTLHLHECVASYINKCRDEDLSLIYERCMRHVDETLETFDDNQMSRGLLLLAWVTKALVLRRSSLWKTCLDKLLSGLNERSLAATAAYSLHVILQAGEDVLTPAQHARGRLLYRQHVFVTCKDPLRHGYHTADLDLKPHYLMALSNILNHVPKEVSKPALSELFPLLVQSLRPVHPGMSICALSSVYDVIQEAPEEVVKELPSLLDVFFELSTYQKDMRVRQAALRCVGALTTLPADVTERLVTNVARRLRPALADHKRLVRQEAVRARNEWLLLQTTED